MSRGDYDAIVIGAGIAGIVSAIRLEKDLGLSNVLIVEKDTRFGGTWSANTYPGCACDVPTRLYSLSFEQRKTWNRFFSTQSEIQAYLSEVANKYGLPAKTLLGHTADRATWDAASGLWKVEINPVSQGATSSTIRKSARILVSAMGALSIPRPCDVPGADKFKGPLFHSAKWDHSADINGKNVVVLGNGCSAAQIVPHIAPKVGHMTQIVRSKHWLSPQPKNPYRYLGWLEKYIPGFIRLERLGLALFMESHFLQSDRKYGKGARERYAQVCREYVERCAPPEYHDLLIPDESKIQVACKRRIFDSGYIPSLCRDNVELTNDEAAQIKEHSVVLKSGRELPADVIVHANGFKTDKYFLQAEIVGTDGSLENYWKKTSVPQAYRGTLVSGFPNLFVIWGPNTVTGHYSAIWAIEACAELMTTVLRPVVSPSAKPNASVQVKKAAEEKEQRYITDTMQKKIYTTGCGAWYTDPDTGRVTALAPCLQHTLQRRCRNPVLSDLEYSGISGSPISYIPYLQRVGMLLGLGEVPDPADQGVLTKTYRMVTNYIGAKTLQACSWFFDLVYEWDFPEPYQPKQA